MNDPKFTEKLKKWFDSEHTDANIREGALLLLQMNNNRHLYQLINFDPQGKLEQLKYELQKHLNYRIEGMTIDDVRNYDKAVTPVLQTAIDKTSEADQIAKQLAPHLPVVESENLDSIVPSAIVAKGKRADHDQLPDNIQAIWENNCDLWKKIKEHFEACKAYDMSCDRYEGLHAADEDFKRMLLTLKEEYYAYKQAMDVYDHAQPGDAEEKQAEEQPVADIISKQIGNARSYITKNLNQLIGFVEAGNTDKADALSVLPCRAGQEVRKWLLCQARHSQPAGCTRRRRTDHLHDRSAGTSEGRRPRSKGAAPSGSADLMQNLPRISKQFQPMQRIPTKTPTVQKPCIDRASPDFSGLHNKKERQILRFDVQYLVHLQGLEPWAH